MNYLVWVKEINKKSGLEVMAAKLRRDILRALDAETISNNVEGSLSLCNRGVEANKCSQLPGVLFITLEALLR